jgi:hypothetical protein
MNIRHIQDNIVIIKTAVPVFHLGNLIIFFYLMVDPVGIEPTTRRL